MIVVESEKDEQAQISTIRNTLPDCFLQPKPRYSVDLILLVGISQNRQFSLI